MSGDGRVLGQWFLRSEEMKQGSDWDQAMDGLCRRFNVHGFTPRLYYTDNYRKEEQFMKRKIPSLRDDYGEQDSASVDLRKKYPLVSCEALKFREYALQSGSTLKSVASKVGYCDTTESACTVANMISQRLVRDGSGNAVMGLDCEWTPANKRGRGHAYYDSIDMIQIACELTCHVRGHEHEVEHIVVCFHVAHFTRREIPTQLRALLEDKRILKVGRGIKGDCTRLRRDNRTAIMPPDELYDGRKGDLNVQIAEADVEDVGPMCHELGVVGKSNAKLSVIVMSLFGHVMSKARQTEEWHQDFRCRPATKSSASELIKDWSNGKQNRSGLSTWGMDSVLYAGLDAAYSLAVHLKAKDLVERQQKQPNIGDKVAFLGPNNQVHGTGKLVAPEGSLSRVQVLEVFSPALMCTGGLREHTQRKSLSDWAGDSNTIQWEPDRVVPFIPEIHKPEVIQRLAKYSADDDSWKNNKIKADPVHIDFKVFRPCSSRHSCFGTFCGDWKDAYFGINGEDIAETKAKLKAQGLSDADIEAKYKYNYNYFVRKSRRAVPCPSELAKRLGRAVQTAKSVPDEKQANSGKDAKLWTPNAEEAWIRVLADIRDGYLSDHPDINYYYTREGKQMCLRGTSALEGYHHHLRSWFGAHFMAPLQLVYYASERNYRSGCKMQRNYLVSNNILF
jgi:hypothetical protein